MSVANLTGTTWRFNEAITLSGAVFDINFINNNHSYQYTDVDSNAFAYGNDDYVYVYTMANGWINESYRTIEITGGTDATSQTAIDWFEANAVQILSIIGNPLTVGGGTGSSGGTVTITDTQDAAGGTIRAITTNPAATIIEALTATANAIYTPTAGHAYGPVTVNVAGGSSYTLLGSEEFTVNTTSTSYSSVGTISCLNDVCSTNKIIMCTVCDKAGKRNGYFLSSVSFLINSPDDSTGSTINFTTPISIRVSSSGEYTVASSSASGLWGRYLSANNATVSIYSRYSSTTGTLNGTYICQVWALDFPANFNPWGV